MRVLILDLETSPLVVHSWALFNQNIGINQILDDTRVIGVAAKWYDGKRVMWFAEDKMSHEEMIEKTWALVDEADVIIHFNGVDFDMRHLRREFLQQGLLPPAPWKDVDLLKEVKKNFRFPSNKLAYVTDRLGLSGKMTNSGHEMWVKCLAGDKKAWAEMGRYARQDVVTTEELFERLRPWLKLPHPALYNAEGEVTTCSCGGALHKRGFAYTGTRAYQRYRCVECGHWMQDTRSAFSIQIKDA